MGSRRAETNKETTRAVDPRVLRSRAAILEAATRLFLRDGYVATTMDEIANAANVSKRTVYNNFTDKEALFRDVVLAAARIAAHFAADAAAELADPDDLPDALRSLARRLIIATIDPRVLRLRRLLIGEAARFPDLADDYYRLAPGRVMSTLATAIASLAKRGRLQVVDPRRSAEHFAFLVLGAALDRAMFDGRDSNPTTASLTRAADEGVRAFLAAYGPREPPA